MIRVRKLQMAALEESAQEVLVHEIGRHLREEHAELVEKLTDEVLLARIRYGVHKAERYGMTWDTTITAFVAIMFEVSPSFDEHPAIRSVLENPSIAPNGRIDALWDRTSEEEWDDAESRGQNWPRQEQ